MLTKLFLNSIPIFIAFIFLLQPVEAQIIQTNRFEMPLSEKKTDVVSAGSNGLFLISKIEGNQQSGNQWNVIKLDSSFNANWNRLYTVPSNQQLLSKYYDNENLYFLFSKNDARDRNLELIAFNVHTGFAVSHVIRNYIPFSLFDFKVTKDAAIIGGYFNYRPFVMLYNFNDRVPILLPGLFKENAELAQIKMSQDETFDILISGENSDKLSTIFIHTYSSKGELLRQVGLVTENRKGLLFGRMESLGSRAQLVAGVYGNNNSEFSKGIFLANVNEYGEQQLKYYNYGELSNFFNYMRSPRENRVRNRIERRKSKNKKLRFSYRLLVHDIIRDGDNYMLLGEAFYPKYSNISQNFMGIFSPSWSFNRGGYPSRGIFEGYQYTHAVLLGFDKTGNLLWDNSFKINDVISYELEQLVHVSKSNDKTALLYVYNDQIRSKIIKENEVVEDKELIPIKLKYESDQLVENSTIIQGLDSWYDNVFITYGSQEIKNLTSGEVDLKREVFFINKVIYK